MFIQRGPTDCWLWQADPDKAPNKGALMACRDQSCCNPRHLVQAVQEPEEYFEETQQLVDERDELKAILDDAGIDYRKNASLDSLREAVNELSANRLAK